MLPKEREMEVLEAYDLTKSYRSAAQLCGVDHHTVARVVAARALGADWATSRWCGRRSRRRSPTRSWSGSNGRTAGCGPMSFTTSWWRWATRVRSAQRGGWWRRSRRQHDRDHHRVYKPWITEPGVWLQYDFGAGPVIDGLAVILFCAWLAWSRFRFIIPIRTGRCRR